MSQDLRDSQQAGLQALVDRVRSNAGFVHGYWSEDVDDPAVSLNFIVFETLDQALDFRDAVLANAPAQADAGVARGELRIVSIKAEA